MIAALTRCESLSREELVHALLVAAGQLQMLLRTLDRIDRGLTEIMHSQVVAIHDER